MFEYDLFCLKVYGFIKIKYIDKNRLIFKYKNKELIVTGKELQILNYIDKSIEIKGLIENIMIQYSGDVHD